MRNGCLVACVMGLGLAIAGCGTKTNKLEVTGKVTFDDKDVPDGEIKFIPENKDLAAEGGKIKDGKYAVKVNSGKYRVEIRATREVPGKKDPMGTGPLIDEYIPERYNAKSDLSADVGEGKTE